MKTLLIKSIMFCLGMFLSSQLYAQHGWDTVHTGNGFPMSTVRAVNDSTVFVIGGGGVILASYDKGISWDIIEFPSTSFLKNMYFLNNLTGFTMGYDGLIHKTTNGGVNWLLTQSNTNEVLNSMFFITDQKGICVGNNGKYLYTNNGGSTWDSLHFLTQRRLYDVSFADDHVGIIVGDFAGVYRTSNGGDNWVFISLNEYIQPKFFTVKFINESTGFIGGGGECCGYPLPFYHRSSFQKTTDKGLTWTNLFSYDYKWVYSISFVNQLTGYATGLMSSLFKTTDSGNNWILYNLPTGQRGYTSSTFLNDSVGFIMDASGFLLKTENGGVVNIQLMLSEIPYSFSLHQNYPNPFNPSTKIKFEIPKGSLVKLKIYDILGREVAELVNEKLNPGTYEYEWNGINLPSGVYFYKLQSENFVETKRMVLVK